MLSLGSANGAVGTFIKTDSTQIVEVLGLCGLDFAVLDAEHAPFDRGIMDRMLLAARAVSLPMLVRIPDHRDATILSVLDMGAGGIVVPHIDDVAAALNVLQAARFVGGRRGISLSARFGHYGTRPRAEAIADADGSLVICQIESGPAVEAIEEIAMVPGLGGLLIGRSDLALSLGLDSARHPVVMQAVTRIIAAASRSSVPVLMACADEAEMAAFVALGAHGFVVGSDQSLLRAGAAKLRSSLTLAKESDQAKARATQPSNISSYCSE